jgi:aminoglycoside phosphotransferase family enzyme/predicted kinase
MVMVVLSRPTVRPVLSIEPAMSALSNSDLVRDLTRPESYPEPRPREITLRTTHISWVFLTEDTAYKVKRPVKLGFVDFTTAEARAHFCHEEVRLNAALAPGVYQGVVPIRRGETGLSFIGYGDIVDHAVQMRRLPDDRSAAALLAAGKLTFEHLAALADRLARFYATAPVQPHAGGFEAMWRNLEENLQELAGFAGDPLDQSRLRAVATAQRRDLRRLQATLDERATAHFVREGHGDLRLEHVYFPDVEAADPLILDCVEFEPRFRVGDVALDIAFLIMELEAAGASNCAAYLLYRFARATGDFTQYLLLDFYACYRALVRAKIACLLAHDPATPAAKATSKRAEASRLLALAYAHAIGQAERPVVIAVGGVVGAGKSTLAETLARRLGLPVISSDIARKHTVRTYNELIRRADQVLRSGRSVVLDATFGSPATRAQAWQLADAHAARFLFVQLGCHVATLRARLRTRAQHPHESDADEAVLDETLATFVPPDELPPNEVLLLPTASDASVEAIVERICAPEPATSPPMVLPIIPTPMEVFESACRNVFQQHLVLRRDLQQALMTGNAAARGDEEAIRALPFVIITLLGKLTNHMAFEESVLAPVMIGAGQAAANRMASIKLDHRRQRDEFQAVLRLAGDPAESVDLAVTLQNLVADVLSDMGDEELSLTADKTLVKVATSPQL